ncbi:BatA domain-containing protein [Galbibacter sp. EGI 63066]|uniref:BatA domain-containing protein n=1 Tax=Galbibacter sp. EGI 63066 TaxID=2993559 RepID=UPI00224897DE|nr:BatA domain-containing protein [Galbibacter sp. EGI 63066]MCX2678989.1 BatA domain-containing protein [Galbibacter sp. EGI 63066]
MIFTHPTYLWALLGLAIPIAIHLWSKKEGKTILVGSVKLLKDTDPKQTRSIKLNELWLLILRLLAIGLLAIIMANPQITASKSKADVMYLIEASLLPFDEKLPVLDTVSEENIRLLTEGFPIVSETSEEEIKTSTPDYWQLARDMEQLQTDSIVIFTKALLKGIRGKRPRVNTNAHWVVIDSCATVKKTIQATQKGEEIELLHLISNCESLSFEKELMDFNSEKLTINLQKDSVKLSGYNHWLSLDSLPSLKAGIVYDEATKNEKRYFESAYKAISKHLDRPIEVASSKVADSIAIENLNTLVWLSEAAIVKFDLPTIVYKKDGLANRLITKSDTEKLFYLTQPLNTENSISKHFTEQLMSTLYLNTRLGDSVRKYDNRVVDTQELLPVRSAEKTVKAQMGNIKISKWLWPVLFLLLIVERVLALYRKQ